MKRKRGRRRFLLYVRPGRPPVWWPREIYDGKVRPRAVGVFRGGDGWIVGRGDPMTAHEVEVAKQNVDVKWPVFSIARV